MRMVNIVQLLAEHMDIWTAADTEKKSGRGRASGNAGGVYGVKKLRELILELAVRGKLVPQDANDEPASELLKRIQTEKAKLIAEGKIKVDKPLEAISEDEKLFDLPEGWQWGRIGTIGHDWGQKTPNSDFTYIEVSAVDSQRGVVSSPEVVKPENAPSRARKLVKKGTVIYSTVRPYLLNIAVIEDDFQPEPIASTAFAIVHPFCQMPPRYFLYFFRSPLFVQYVESVQMGIAYPAINDGQFFTGLIPIPPIEEQQRIVAKVDELMALCAQLEKQHSNAQEAHETLVSELLATLTQSQNAAEFNANWQRIYAHFDVLFTTEASIDSLKQTLLQLAVMGKLVPQDPNEGSAENLVIETQNYFKQVYQTTLTKLERDKSILEPIEYQYSIPESWVWCELQDICMFFNGKAHEMFVALDGQFILVNSSFISNDGDKVKRVSECLFPLEKNDMTIVMSDVPNGKALVRCFIVEENRKYSLNQRIGCLRLPKFLNINYIRMVIERNKYYLDYDDGQKQTNLKKIQVLSCPVPLPPLKEQNRIVTKVDVLMALCDQLKNRIQQANQQKQAIADTLVAQAVQATAEIIDVADYRAATACYAIKKMQGKSYFGRTAAMKVLYLAEAHLGLPLSFQPMREAAGPLDKWIYAFEKQGEHEGWFKVVEPDMHNGKTKVEYQAKLAIAQKSVLIEKICSDDQLKEFDRLLGLLADKTTEEAEIIATLFAAWNDFLIDGNAPSDDEIVKEVRENWHESKARFTPTQLEESLRWMRLHHLVPQGRLPRTVYQQQLITS